MKEGQGVLTFSPRLSGDGKIIIDVHDKKAYTDLMRGFMSLHGTEVDVSAMLGGYVEAERETNAGDDIIKPEALAASRLRAIVRDAADVLAYFEEKKSPAPAPPDEPPAEPGLFQKEKSEVVE